MIIIIIIVIVIAEVVNHFIADSNAYLGILSSNYYDYFPTN